MTSSILVVDEHREVKISNIEASKIFGYENKKEIEGIHADKIISTTKIIESFQNDINNQEKDKGQTYKIVKIGSQWWMAENLNYYTSLGSWFYSNDSLQYSEKYGRLYKYSLNLRSISAICWRN